MGTNAFCTAKMRTEEIKLISSKSTALFTGNARVVWVGVDGYLGANAYRSQLLTTGTCVRSRFVIK